MENCINGAKSLIDKQVKLNKIKNTGVAFDGYQKVYGWTNENIKAYLDSVDFNGKDSALSVMASGDQAFNLINKGILNIDTFDTNMLTEYYVFGLKRAMILKYNYKEFIFYMEKLISKTTDIDEISSIIFDLLPYMDEKHRLFWSTIVDYNLKVQKINYTNLNLLHMLLIGINIKSNYLYFNNYLENEEQYNILRNNLAKANLTFKQANAYHLDQKFHKKYDFIILSNILDYFTNYFGNNWDYMKLKEYEEKLSFLTKEDGVVFLKYILLYATDNYTREILFRGARVESSDLTDEKIIKIKQCSATSAVNIYDGMILKRF